jgi:hypothetical protein
MCAVCGHRFWPPYPHNTTKNTNNHRKIKNSWGAGWGEGGYIRISRQNSVDLACGVLEDASFPILEPVKVGVEGKGSATARDCGGGTAVFTTSAWALFLCACVYLSTDLTDLSIFKVLSLLTDLTDLLPHHHRYKQHNGQQSASTPPTTCRRTRPSPSRPR